MNFFHGCYLGEDAGLKAGQVVLDMFRLLVKVHENLICMLLSRDCTNENGLININFFVGLVMLVVGKN